MSKLTRHEAHLLVAGIRVLDHQLQRPPSPKELADLLDLPESSVRLQVNLMADLEIILVIESAFESHVEIKDYRQIESLDNEAGPAISDDLAAFDRRKEEENERLANLFDSGEHERVRQDRLKKMEDELGGFKGKKPPNPFGD